MKRSNPSSNKAVARIFHIRGCVQGVGFRPFVYRSALKHRITGSVQNRSDGVFIQAEGADEQLTAFREELRTNTPEAAVVKEFRIESSIPTGAGDFEIIPSNNNETVRTEISPDIAICDACSEELQSENRRNNYPLINCTNCGPRFTIINNLPYDRPETSMKHFKMCPECMREYETPENRRFHAQPISCPSCGPSYSYLPQVQKLSGFTEILSTVAQALEQGNVVAIKGLGGYNLACDATQAEAIRELRKFKQREQKPFAVMCRSLQAAQKLAVLSDVEQVTLTSWRRPIVICEQKSSALIDPGITQGLKTIGIFLPYLPLHQLLFEQISCNYLVMTSGNESDVPILYQDEIAAEYFSTISGGILSNNRDILRRCDDSVVKVIQSDSRILRRARGYTPAPIDLSFTADGILATGAELANTFCMGKEQQAIFSQHIGDIKNLETFEFFSENIIELSRIFKFAPNAVACDLHPDYRSTQYAKNSGLPIIEVQHHHAHIASVMAEYQLDEPVIGLAWDGTGLGTDGHSWGSEAMVADYREFKRISHFEYIALPGGDKAVQEPWRTGLSYLYQTYGLDYKNLNIPFIQNLNKQMTERLIQAIDKKINCPYSCGAGRLFDAVAAITGLCTHSRYHAEAPQRLEDYANTKTTDSYSFTKKESISFADCIREIVHDLQIGTNLSVITTRFHNTLARAALHQVQLTSQQTELRKVILSGGSFQNKYLTEKIVYLLEREGFQVFIPREISCNDSGIALGQLAVAAHKR